MIFKLKQGDACAVPVKIRVNGEDLSEEAVERAEFMVGGVRKLYPEEVYFEGESGCFLVPLTQEDTFSLPEDEGVRLDVRVKFKGGCVIGTRRLTVVLVDDAVSEKVI